MAADPMRQHCFGCDAHQAELLFETGRQGLGLCSSPANGRDLNGCRTDHLLIQPSAIGAQHDQQGQVTLPSFRCSLSGWVTLPGRKALEDRGSLISCLPSSQAVLWNLWSGCPWKGILSQRQSEICKRILNCYCICRKSREPVNGAPWEFQAFKHLILRPANCWSHKSYVLSNTLSECTENCFVTRWWRRGFQYEMFAASIC